MARVIIKEQIVPMHNQPNPPEGMRAITEDEGYFYCREFIPAIAGTYKGSLIITAGGKSMWEDFARAKELRPQAHIMAINVSAIVIMHVNHIYSMHFKQISIIRKWREVEFAGAKFITHANKEWEGVDYTWYLTGQVSTSGFAAVTLGHLLGYDEIILAGVPMDGSGYFYKPEINPTFDDVHREKEISWMKEKLGHKVRSMSGKTKEAFGLPE
jgi:hypothetical protein